MYSDNCQFAHGRDELRVSTITHDNRRGEYFCLIALTVRGMNYQVGPSMGTNLDFLDEK